MCREVRDDLRQEVTDATAPQRLDTERLNRLQSKAASAHQKLLARAKQRVLSHTNTGNNNEAEAGLFFSVLFQLAAQDIEADVEGFCDRADEIFEEIEAHGNEPQLDSGWLCEVTGEKDNFYFSTENLVSDLVSPPRKNRHKKVLSQQERERITKEIERAIIDDDHTPHNLYQALAVAHGENVEGWIRTINRALEKSNSESLDFWMLQKMTGLEPAELLLGLLLGQEHWMIKQRDFYDEVLVERKKKGEGSIHQ